MMRVTFSIFLVQLLVLSAFSKKDTIPDYIKPCSASDPNFEKCCLDHGKEALPYILKGDKKFGIPNMIPLVIPQINVNAGGNIKIGLKDVSVYGLDKTNLEAVKIDLKNLKFSIKLKIPELELKGKYDIDGKILVLPIKGNGDFNLNAIDGVYEYKADYIIKQVNGVDNLELTEKDDLDFTLQNLKLHLENLFDGNKKLGDEMNKFLNDNWKDILNEFGPAVSETIRSIGRSIASAIFKKVPYHDLFLE